MYDLVYRRMVRLRTYYDLGLVYKVLLPFFTFSFYFYTPISSRKTELFNSVERPPGKYQLAKRLSWSIAKNFSREKEPPIDCTKTSFAIAMVIIDKGILWFLKKKFGYVR
jgi:hypothetical protein